MIKSRLKTLYLGILTALLLLCAVFFIVPKNVTSAKADGGTYNRPAESNARFSWYHGGAIRADDYNYDPDVPEDMPNKFGMAIGLELVDPQDADLFTNYLTPKNLYSYYQNPTQNYFEYHFTIYRDVDGDSQGNLGDPVPLAEYIFVFYYKAQDRWFFGRSQDLDDINFDYYGCYLLEKNWYSDEAFLFTTSMGNGVSVTESQQAELLKELNHAQEGFKVTKYYSRAKSLFTSSDNELRVSIYVPSITNAYFIQLDYDYHYCTDRGNVFNKPSYTNVSGSVASVSLTVQALLESLMEHEEYLALYEPYFNEWAVENIQSLLGANEQTITIQYLEQIEGTPYAEKKSQQVTVPVYNGKPNLDDVVVALGRENLNCCGSYAYTLNLVDEATNTYCVRYLAEVWLRSVSADGNYIDYIFDINRNYHDYYYPFVEDGIVSQGLYEWVFSNQMMDKFPQLQGYEFQQVYGYFGIVAVPTTYTLNSAFKKMFDVDTSQFGTVTAFSFENSFSHENYMQLLDEYDYGWLSKAWNTVEGFTSGSSYSATYYWFYVEPGTERVLINEAGGTDFDEPGSVIDEEIGRPISNLLAGTLDLTQNVFDFLDDALGGIGGAVSTVGGLMGNKTTWIVIMIIALVGLGVYLYIQYKK